METGSLGLILYSFQKFIPNFWKCSREKDSNLHWIYFILDSWIKIFQNG